MKNSENFGKKSLIPLVVRAIVQSYMFQKVYSRKVPETPEILAVFALENTLTAQFLLHFFCNYRKSL